MATPITWKFVDTPVASPTVLLDMNDGATWRIQTPGPKMPTPNLKQTWATNPMNDGAILSSEAYDNRVLTWTTILFAATPAARIAQLDALKAQLSKPAGLLMYNPPGWSFPVFFRTVGGGDYQIDNKGGAGAEWYVTCQIEAEPFAIGIRRDLSTVTITNNPASGANPMIWDITGIVGDAPTPAFTQLSGLGAGGTAILAQRTTNNPTALTVFAQTDAGTLGPDTTTWTNAAMSGGTGTSTTFSSDASLQTRITCTVPTATNAAALRGRYRVFLRVHTGGTTAQYAIRLVQNPGSADQVFGPVTTYQATTTWEHIDLGVINFPTSQAPTSIGYSGLAAGFVTASLGVQASRSGGLDNLDTDYLYLMPADERLCVTNQVAAVNSLILDGPNDMTYGMASGSTPFGSTRNVDNGGALTPRIGGLPQLVPSVTNRWHLIIAKAVITATTTVTVSYWPRWREVATS